MEEEFDGTALRGLLEPAVAGRGATAAPTDAIVTAGLRRERGRRVAVAGGALAIVAAVPLAASALAAGPDAAKTSAAAGGNTPPARPTTAAPLHAGAVTDSAPAGAAKTVGSKAPKAPPLGPLPKTPQLLAQGTLDGKKWTVSGVESNGNNELTKNSRCLKLLITDGGRDLDPAVGDVLMYCDGSGLGGYQLTELQYDVPGGSGNLAIGTAPAKVAKIVAHVQGVADPVTVQTVPAPGAADAVIYVVPAGTGITPRIDFDEYDAQGQKIGHADTYSDPSGLPMLQPLH